MKYFFYKAKRSNFSPSYEGEREGVAVRSETTPPNLPSYEGRKFGGFTLIELLIAIAIFSVVLIIITGVFSRFVAVQRHSIEQGTLILETQSVMETFIKEARTAYGSTYSSSNAGREVTFNNQSGTCVSYRVNDTTDVFERAENPVNPKATCALSGFSDGQYAPLASKSITFSNVFFDANPSIPVGSTLELQNQGVITLVLTATSEKSKTDVLPLTLQNTVASRQTRAYEE
ncbi:MAG: prepilin-type N-terminal cleavage/methylation domain-containing protein [Patescibacteria group bacterium]